MRKWQPGQKEPIAVLVTARSRLECDMFQLCLQRSAYRFQVTGCAWTSVDLRNSLHSHLPDVALISASLQDGEMAGMNVVQEIRSAFPQLPLVLLVDKTDRHLVIGAFRAGVRGTFSRSESFEDLCKSIYQVRHGQVWASAHELQYVLEALTSAVPPRLVDARGNELLTDREQQVVQLVAEGLTNREVGKKLKLTEHTVKNYLFRIFDKLGVSSRVELILYTMNQRQQSEMNVGRQLPQDKITDGRDAA